MTASINLIPELTPRMVSPTAAVIYAHRISDLNRSRLGTIASIICECGYQSTSVYNEEANHSDDTHVEWSAEKGAHAIHAEHVAYAIRNAVSTPPATTT